MRAERRWRTILGLMMVVAASAVILAAIRSPSLVWASLFFNLSFALNVLAVVALIVGHGRTRTVGIGFAVCGWGYFTITRVFGAIIKSGMIFSRSDVPPLVAEVLAEFALGWVGPANPSQEVQLNALWTFEAITTIAAGVAGAAYALFLTRDRPDPDRTTTSPVDLS